METKTHHTKLVNFNGKENVEKFPSSNILPFMLMATGCLNKFTKNLNRIAEKVLDNYITEIETVDLVSFNGKA